MSDLNLIEYLDNEFRFSGAVYKIELGNNKITCIMDYVLDSENITDISKTTNRKFLYDGKSLSFKRQD